MSCANNNNNKNRQQTRTPCVRVVTNTRTRKKSDMKLGEPLVRKVGKISLMCLELRFEDNYGQRE